jgi:nitrous oxide reductase accessory protein NosL
MEDINAQTGHCLREETDRLKEDIRHCDYCASSIEEHRQCYVETARKAASDPRCFSDIVSSFSVTCQKTKQKSTPVPRLILRVAVAAGARGN